MHRDAVSGQFVIRVPNQVVCRVPEDKYLMEIVPQTYVS